MRPIRTLSTLAGVLISIAGATPARADGTAVVRVVTVPEVSGVSVRFSGEPAGQFTLVPGNAEHLAAEGLAPGSYSSTLQSTDPSLVESGYMLVDISCNDTASAGPSSGAPPLPVANFRIEEGEKVTCTFTFTRMESSCTCPREGRWRVANHPGQMVCTGAMNMTLPLAASSGTGTMEIQEDCSTVVARGMSEDEATMIMRVTDDCRYMGTVGGSQDGIPMTIEFTWYVQDEESITGDLKSTVAQQGMTCNMSRGYELSFDG